MKKTVRQPGALATNQTPPITNRPCLMYHRPQKERIHIFFQFWVVDGKVAIQ
ncbi:hypothetical protein C8J48_3738 [Desmospora activa DSM 45169]|uniref:Uncharacterized protein n=1 Tax=Desmospora activa DSM 45169 TaxID=1121389 RepID=A0A2T4YYX8_9BACL|nr:hypothetical protein C8J48_3738 [Desmospora activa DSM 45169]